MKSLTTVFKSNIVTFNTGAIHSFQEDEVLYLSSLNSIKELNHHFYKIKDRVVNVIDIKKPSNAPLSSGAIVETDGVITKINKSRVLFLLFAELKMYNLRSKHTS